MKTIKVIDLLNKIANGEEVPEKIIWNEDLFEYDKGQKAYVIESINGMTKTLLEYVFECDLNDEVELIEEDKEIEEVSGIELLGQCDNWLQKRDVNIKSDFELNLYILEAINRNFKGLYHKQCELIKAVNELKKGK